MNKIALIVVTLGTVASCNLDETDPGGPDGKLATYAPYVSHVILVSDLQERSDDGRALIDLGAPEVGYWVAPEIDHVDVDIVCPNGQVRPLQQELDEIDMSPARWEDGIFIYPLSGGKESLQQKAAPVCSYGCDAVYEPATRSWHCTC